MSPDIWRSIAVGTLIAGVLFLIIALFLSVKFHLISIIRSAVESSKESKEPVKQGYFDYRQSSDSERSVSVQPVFPSRNEDNAVYSGENTSATVLPSGGEASATVITHDEEASATVITCDEDISATVITHDENIDTNGTVIISTDEPQNVPDKDEFIILNNIIVINGSTDSVKCRKSQ